MKVEFLHHIVLHTNTLDIFGLELFDTLAIQEMSLNAY
jgi:hypothetical protein